MILAVIEHDNGVLHKSVPEMLTLARQVAEATDNALEALLVGEAARPLAGLLGEYGVTTAHLMLNERLEDYAPVAWAQAVLQRTAQLRPGMVLAAGTERGNEVMAHVAARLGQPLAAQCVAIRPGDSFQVTRLRWGGSLLEEAVLEGEPRLATVAPLVVTAAAVADPSPPAVQDVAFSLDEADLAVRITARAMSDSEGVSLADAPVVVGGGRGVGSAEGFQILDRLAALLDGAVGSSRAATNLGWRPHADQIGQTGTRIGPELYIACGISGAIQHMVGCKGSKRILAINTDPDAPIIAKADYAVIGDLHEVIPALIAELEKIKGA